MAYMKTDAVLLIGVPAIDDQHQSLISVINDMYEEIAACRTLDEERVLTGKFIEKLREFAKIHFEAEEMILIHNNYPRLAQHQAEHKLFIDELKRIWTSHTTGELALSFDVFLFAREWIANHINVSDQAYIEFLNL